MIDKHIAELAKYMGTAYLNCRDDIRPRSCIFITPDEVTMIMKYFEEPPQVEVQIFWGKNYSEGAKLLTLTREG